jgi:hypothetical protein
MKINLTEGLQNSTWNITRLTNYLHSFFSLTKTTIETNKVAERSREAELKGVWLC